MSRTKAATTQRAKEIAEKVTELTPITGESFRAKYKCSYRVMKEVFAIKGWKTARQLKEEKKANADLSHIADYLKNVMQLSLRQISENYNVDRHQAKEAYRLAGMEPPNRSQGKILSLSNKSVWPQSADAMSGMKSLMLLRQAWV